MKLKEISEIFESVYLPLFIPAKAKHSFYD